MEVIWRDWPAQRQRRRAIVAAVLIVLTSVSIAVIEPLIAAIGEEELEAIDALAREIAASVMRAAPERPAPAGR